MKKSNLIKRLNGLLLSFLKNKAVKLAVKKLATSGIFAGVWGFFISFAVKELFDEVIEPLLKAATAEIGYKYNKKQGKILIEKLNKAENENNENDFDDTLDDIFN